MAADSTGRVYLPGHDQETASAAVAEIRGGAADAPFALMRDATTPDETTQSTGTVDTDTDLRAWCEADKRMMYFQRSTSNAPIQAAFDLQQAQTVAVLAQEGQLPDVGAAARLSAVDYEGFNTQITLHGKTFPNVAGRPINDTDFAALQAIRGNIYTRVDGSPVFIEGLTSRPDYYADTVWWIMWAQNALERAAWGALKNSRRLTRGALRAALVSVMQRGVKNGGLKPGLEVSEQTAADIRRTTGNASFNGVLITGYLVHVGRVTGRRAPVKIWCAGSEAIHRAGIDLVFLNDLAEAASTEAVA